MLSEERQSKPVKFKDVLASTLSGTWPKVVIGVYALELIVLFFGSMLPLSQSTINQVANQNSSLAVASDSLGFLARVLFLFSNNFKLGALDLVPVLGWFVFGFSMFNTAIAVNVIGITQHLPGPLVMISLLLQPHSWLELPAYAIAVTQSFYLISTVRRRSQFRFEVVRTGVVIAIVAVELTIAALFESMEISIANSLLLEFAIPWILFALLIGLFVAGRRWLLGNHQSNIAVQQPQQIIRFCTKCGARVQDGAFFCDQCGESLLRSTPRH